MLWLANSGGAPEPASDFWFSPIGMSGGSSRLVASRAMQLSAVFKCVRVVSETVGLLPLVLYRRLPGGGKERAVNHPLYPLLALQPNAIQTSMDWRMQEQAHIELRGNAYSRKEFRGARVVALWPMHPDDVKVELTQDRRSLRYTYSQKGAKPEVLLQDEVLHLRGLSLDGYMGLNVMEAERQALGLTWDAEEFAARFYQNDATPGGWLEHPSNFKDKETRMRFLEAWRESQGAAKRGSTAVLEYGMKYHEVGMKMVDAQFMETRKYQATDIAGIFRVPPHKIGILDQAKFANIEQQSIDFVTDAILPRCRSIEQRLGESLLSDDEQRDYFFEFMLEGLLRGDAAARGAFYKEGITDGWLTRNEVREIENRNPLPGLDAPLQPLNMTDGSQPATGGRQQRMERAAAEAVTQKELNSLRNLKWTGEPDEAFATYYRTELLPFASRVLAVSEARLLSYATDGLERALQAHRAGRLNDYLSQARTTRVENLLECLAHD